MDPLTHTAVGLFLGRAGLRRATPYAMPILLLAANAPDVDVVSTAGGALNYLTWHRNLTHAIVAAPVMALLAVLVVRAVVRKPVAWWNAWLIALIAVGTHLALDSTNVYGIRLLLPFRASWYHLDLTSVIDLPIWGAILLAVAGPALGRMVAGEIGAEARAVGRRSAIAALGFIALYNCGHAVLHARAVALEDARLYGGAAPLRVAAFPDAVNPWRFRGVVETREAYRVFDLRLGSEFDPEGGQTFYKAESSRALEAARATKTFQEFLGFSLYPLWRVTPVAEPENGVEVQAMDLRFGTPQRPAFVATATVDGQGRVLRDWYSFGLAGPR